jgi:hypothetical protein
MIHFIFKVSLYNGIPIIFPWYSHDHFENKMDSKNLCIWKHHGIPSVFPWISYRQDLVAELPWILGQEEEQVVVMLGIPRAPGAVGVPVLIRPSHGDLGYRDSHILGNLHIILVHMLTKKVWISIRTSGKWLNKHE